jgi:hypothetical protein
MMMNLKMSQFENVMRKSSDMKMCLCGLKMKLVRPWLIFGIKELEVIYDKHYQSDWILKYEAESTLLVSF